jgi:hypothetical protein
VTTAILLGAGLGAGLWALAVWLVPPRPALGTVLHRATTASAPASLLTTSGAHWSIRYSRPLVALLCAAGLPTPAILRDLTVLERPVDTFLAEKGVLAISGLLGPAVAAVAFGAVGGSLDVQVPLGLAVGCAAIGFLTPDLRVRRRAAQRRADFRHALSAYLDLVVISLAGGAGVDSALNDSVVVGRGWAFVQLERALTAARLTRTTPWATLRQLGRELDITELAELAASVSLAGTEGARVRRSLTAKAVALRARELTDAEAKAGADTERMSLPVMALFLGFLLFIAYPAVSQVLNGL